MNDVFFVRSAVSLPAAGRRFSIAHCQLPAAPELTILKGSFQKMVVEFLYSIDETVFLILNRGVANPVFDFIMPIITEEHNQMIPIVVAWLGLVIFGGKKGRITALLVVVLITLSNFLSSEVIKPLVGRVRPCFVVDGVRLLIEQSRSPSFPSSHAANNAAWAALFSVKYSRLKWVFIFIAGMIAYSRIYIGVHYPSDMIAGAVLGVGCAFFVLFLERCFHRIRTRRKRRGGEQEVEAIKG